MDAQNLADLAHSCDEFLVHGVDVEGKQLGVDRDLIELLGQHVPVPTTYAGGVQSMVRTRTANESCLSGRKQRSRVRLPDWIVA